MCDILKVRDYFDRAVDHLLVVRRSHAMKTATTTLSLQLLILFGVFLFFRGFFLTRKELKDVGNCPRHRDETQSTSSGDPTCDFNSATSDTAYVPFKKAVIIIIDALRIDFVKPGSLRGSAGDDDDDASEAAAAFPYLNHMGSILKVLESHPANAFLARFDADPPTTTMQRLKGMTTGGLPTFIDIKDDFTSEEIQEDNVIAQAIRHGRRVVFMGDDTWGNLFPNKFVRAYPYPSFNVKDLDTVDEGVMRHLAPELAKEGEWDILIGHFLGVDHAGHRYGPKHPEMTRKLEQMNRVLGELVGGSGVSASFIMMSSILCVCARVR